jgi:hypothetical protein
MTMRLIAPMVLASMLLVQALASHAAPRDAVALFRDEIVEATAQLKWRGPKLTDETLLAVAASGIGWRPAAGGAALLRDDRKGLRYSSAEVRLRGFSAAVREREDKAAFAFALSLVLDPAPAHADWSSAVAFVSQYDDGFDKVLVGILQAPERLPLLPAYEYAVADVLVFRGSVRLLPLLLTLADSKDDYLRSRAIAALGVAACRRDYASPPRSLLFAPRAQTLSVGQRRMVAQALERAASDRSVRVRAAAAMALGLAGGEDEMPTLERLLQDPACLRSGGKSRATLVFPVRSQAADALADLGREQAPVGGVFEGAELKRALRGTIDVSRELAPGRRGKASAVKFHTGIW